MRYRYHFGRIDYTNQRIFLMLYCGMLLACIYDSITINIYILLLSLYNLLFISETHFRSHPWYCDHLAHHTILSFVSIRSLLPNYGELFYSILSFHIWWLLK